MALVICGPLLNPRSPTEGLDGPGAVSQTTPAPALTWDKVTGFYQKGNVDLEKKYIYQEGFLIVNWAQIPN